MLMRLVGTSNFERPIKELEGAKRQDHNSLQFMLMISLLNFSIKANARRRLLQCTFENVDGLRDMGANEQRRFIQTIDKVST
jgi:hypothetical protein